MAGTISLKPASSRDYDFALDLYLETMQPFTSEFIVWDEAKQRERFARNWNAADTRIIFAGRRKIGWMQIHESPSEIFVQQFFIVPDQQRRGMGSKVLNLLVPVWNAAGKPVALTVLRNNPARRLYERFGFVVTGEEGVKLRMER